MNEHPSPVREFLHYIVFVIGLTLMGMIPPGNARGMARVFARIFMFFDRKHRKIAAENLRMTQPPVCTPEEIPELVRRTYEHIALSLIEILRIPRVMRTGNTDQYVVMQGWKQIDEALKSGRGAVMVIGHLGNWELCGVALSLMGYPINSLARPVRNRYVYAKLTRMRTQAGQKIIPKNNALRTMVETIRDNKMLVIQADQDFRQYGVFPVFFGRPASTVRSPAVLSLKYDVPIFPAEIYRRNGKQVMNITDPILPKDFRKARDPVTELTQAFTTRLEEFVRRHPEQWIWLLRRWKTTPEKAVKEREKATA